LKLIEIQRINGITLEESLNTTPLWNSVSINPMEKFNLAQSAKDLTGRALDLVVPIGKGQRGLIISPPKSGKTTISNGGSKTPTCFIHRLTRTSIITCA